MNEKLSLPSIKDLLEGGPGLIDYSSSSRNQHQQDQLNKSHRQKSYLRRHRRHASEHITSSTNYTRPNIMLPPPPPIPQLSSLTASSSTTSVDYTPSSVFTNDDNDINKQSISSQYSPASNHYSAPTSSVTAPSTIEHDTIRYAANTSLPQEMQLLSLEKKPKEIMSLKNLLPHDGPTKPSRTRTHSRSYSDFTHNYMSTRPVPSKLSIMSESKSLSTTSSSLPVLLPNPISNDAAIEKPLELVDEKKSDSAQETTISNARYVCPYCKKGFTRPSSLRTHTYSHTGEKPFVCTEPCCGKKFSVQSNLRRHLRIHRLNKPTTLFLPKNIN